MATNSVHCYLHLVNEIYFRTWATLLAYSKWDLTNYLYKITKQFQEM